ncbi:hypothetical protein RvY_07245 [Ramazzottius varieornatus]|uniref:SBF1/SBF2 domain-containing protein n=1 Tax=Ramazzottius varieornatus TaxID=947166 RepID=A0A1D1V6H1_RAMVA|nr:hypothetical protein RvY_07245 [Ramazzottius varieornatus]
MTFFLMKNRFQAGRQEEDNSSNTPTRDGSSSTPRSPFLTGKKTFLSALFDAARDRPQSKSPSRRKNSQAASDASSPSRASSVASGRYPPRRISFDDDPEFGAAIPEERSAGPGRSNTDRQQRPSRHLDNRPEDHSSGTTDPPDEDPDLDHVDDHDHEGPKSRKPYNDHEHEHGSDTSGPDSEPEESARPDDDLVLFMRQFVEKIFHNDRVIDQEEKTKFGECVRSESGRLWFARFVNSMRINFSNKLDDATFFRLVQYCSLVLFECYQEEDYAPAKPIMNICFTFYREVPRGDNSRQPKPEFLYHSNLRKQPIFHSLKFWNAAYFDATQVDRARRSQRTQWENDTRAHNNSSSRPATSSSASSDEDFVYRTLLDFLHNMRAFRVAKESVREFIRKQSHSISQDQCRALLQQLDLMYK